ncbi:hypothetical protein AB0G79_05245 [Streptomyces sp. NPDC020807]|uniref:hypothetical protein n=1 Tax=Streptomyces sp. NPDC020807 TaxID=3155119 RepID=UPI0034064EBC
MSPRNPLPPPPPPAELQAWPDREARVADRALALDALGWRLLGAGRMAMFLVWCALLQLGWAFVGFLLIVIGGPGPDGITLMIGVFSAVLGVGLLVPVVWLTARSHYRDRVARGLLAQWAALDRHGPTDERLRAPVRSACWFVVSFALCGTGLWLGFAVPAKARWEDGGYGLVAYGMGAALIFWTTGLTGLAKAFGHYRFAVRLSAPRPPAGRSASSGHPRPE